MAVVYHPSVPTGRLTDRQTYAMLGEYKPSIFHSYSPYTA